MPHLLIERVRSLEGCTCLTRGEGSSARVCSYMVEATDVIAGLIYTVGSVCFLPIFAQDLEVFIEACFLFVLASAMYMALSGFCLFEAVKERGTIWEASESALYFLGSTMYTIGSILFWPDHTQILNMAWAKRYSLSAYFGYFSTEWEAVQLFIWGSVFFMFAAAINGMNNFRFDNWQARLLIVSTTLYFIGSFIFVIASICYLPSLSQTPYILYWGAGGYIFGSVLFVVGALLSMVRTWIKVQDPEQAALKGTIFSPFAHVVEPGPTAPVTPKRCVP